ncbi:hypothetical protein BACOVA_01933 [Bacteroides ovatus ATCC 8483]|uniref:Uncharacterized protein n=1 Tax=Bacteroides ovatus (strain ATCC 8483 / DSM 1896 / JCM 5824 / BCRC 10623 / CCUG 4943 / NCTC 11153) TaxID=411476 RepID=A0AAN3A9I2_BACO1|nr:hypothetical protein BACOVA_01933 [Bacteroides ovatus ATCC 8483]
MSYLPVQIYNIPILILFIALIHIIGKYIKIYFILFV